MPFAWCIALGVLAWATGVTTIALRATAATILELGRLRHELLIDPHAVVPGHCRSAAAAAGRGACAIRLQWRDGNGPPGEYAPVCDAAPLDGDDPRLRPARYWLLEMRCGGPWPYRDRAPLLSVEIFR